MTLRIRPIRLYNSIYFRVPADIVDLIGLESDSEVTLTIEKLSDRHLLVYSVLGHKPAENAQEVPLYPIAGATPRSTGGIRLANRLS